MKRRNLISATAAVAAVALSACAGTVDGAPVGVGGGSLTTTTTASTTQGTPLPPPTESLTTGQPSWMPTMGMSVDQVMREGAADAYGFWSDAPNTPPLLPLDAEPGDTTCGLPAETPSYAVSCGDGTIRWDVEGVEDRVSSVPYALKRWAVVQITAHEVGHVAMASWVGRKLTEQQDENTAECLAGVYIRHRFETIVTPEDIGTAYKGLGRDGRTPGNAVPQSFFYGLDVSPDLAPRDAFKACVAEWAH